MGLGFFSVDDVNYLENDFVTLAGWGAYYDIRNKRIDKNPNLKLINLRVSRQIMTLVRDRKIA